MQDNRNIKNPISRTFRNILEKAEERDVTGHKAKLALRWYQKQTLVEAKDASPEAVRRLKTRWRPHVMMGRMYFFKYDPLGKDSLPYYDQFPLTLIIDKKVDGFTALNWHYLPYIARATLLDGLMSITNNNEYDDTTKIRTTYHFLKNTSRLKLFRPCFKRYLYSQVRSHYIRVEAEEWPVAVFLPVESFRKKVKNVVWKESLDKVK